MSQRRLTLMIIIVVLSTSILAYVAAQHIFLPTTVEASIPTTTSKLSKSWNPQLYKQCIDEANGSVPYFMGTVDSGTEAMRYVSVVTMANFIYEQKTK